MALDWQNTTRLLYNWFNTEQGENLKALQLQQIRAEWNRMSAETAKDQAIIINDFFEQSVLHDVNTLISLSGITQNKPDVIASPEALPFESNSIDAIFLNYVVEIMDDPHLVIQESYRVLKPEGKLIVIGFCMNSILRWQLRTESPFSLLKYRDIDFYQRLCFLHGYDLLSYKKFSFTNLKKSDSFVIDKVGNYLWPFLGNNFMLSMQKRVESMTPLKVNMKWPKVVSVKNTRLANLASDYKIGKS